MSTDGVQIARVSLDDGPNDTSTALHARLFDFAGQRIFLPTHRLFLSEHALVAVLFHVQRVDWRRLELWLSALQGLQHVAVLVIGTHVDALKEKERRDLLPDLERRISQLRGAKRVQRVLFVNVQDPKHVRDIRLALAETAKTLRPLKKPVSASYRRLAVALQDARAPYVQWPRFAELCGREVDDADLIGVARHLHSAGQLLWFEGSALQDMVRLSFIGGCLKSWPQF